MYQNKEKIYRAVRNKMKVKSPAIKTMFEIMKTSKLVQDSYSFFLTTSLICS